MLEHFAYRHVPPILLATSISIGGMMPYTRGPEPLLLLFGFPPAHCQQQGRLARHQSGFCSSDHDWLRAFGHVYWRLVVQTLGERLKLILFSLGHLEAMNIFFAAMGWMALIDGVVCWRQGAPRSSAFRVSTTGAVALWGLLGMTSDKYF